LRQTSIRGPRCGLDEHPFSSHSLALWNIYFTPILELVLRVMATYASSVVQAATCSGTAATGRQNELCSPLFDRSRLTVNGLDRSGRRMGEV